MYPGVGTIVLIRPAQTSYERIKDRVQPTLPSCADLPPCLRQLDCIQEPCSLRYDGTSPAMATIDPSTPPSSATRRCRSIPPPSSALPATASRPPTAPCHTGSTISASIDPSLHPTPSHYSKNAYNRMDAPEAHRGGIEGHLRVNCEHRQAEEASKACRPRGFAQPLNDLPRTRTWRPVSCHDPSCRSLRIVATAASNAPFSCPALRTDTLALPAAGQSPLAVRLLPWVCFRGFPETGARGVRRGVGRVPAATRSAVVDEGNPTTAGAGNPRAESVVVRHSSLIPPWAA